MSAPELLPCPFCGGEANLIKGPPGCAFVRCESCKASSDDRLVDNTIAAWNRRADLCASGQVRALEWAYCDDEREVEYRAWSPLGFYEVGTSSDGYAWAECDGPSMWDWCPDQDARLLTVDAAKAAAQADFERRINAALIPAPQALHSDDIAVNRFAYAMKTKLSRKRAAGRSGWNDKDACSAAFLSQLLREHVSKGDPVDVGNFAMMLHQRGERIAPQPAGEAGPQPDRLLKDALFASIEPTHQSPLYCGVAVTAMTQACAAVFYVPRNWSRDQIKAWLGNPQGFAHPPQPNVSVAEAAEVLLADDVSISKMAAAVHDGPLGADDYEFSAARPQGAWCVDAPAPPLRERTPHAKTPNPSRPDHSRSNHSIGNCS